MNELILGVDPSSLKVGYGLIICGNPRPVLYGVLELSKSSSVPHRLAKIYNDLCWLIDNCEPQCVVIEKMFTAYQGRGSARTDHVLAQAQAAVIISAVNRDKPVFEYTPSQVKKAVTGKGNAKKTMVRDAVVGRLEVETESLEVDASDALAVALCHIDWLYERTK